MMIWPISLRGRAGCGRLPAWVFQVRVLLLFLLLLLHAGGGALRAQTPVAPAWLMTQTDGSLTYFLFSNRVECYDAHLRTWRPTIALGRGGASKMALNSTHLVVSFGQECHKYTLTGSPLGLLYRANGQVDGLFLDGGLLLVSSYGFGRMLESVSFSTGARLDFKPTDNSYQPLLGLPARNRIYGSTSGLSSPGYYEYSDAGVFGTGAGLTGASDFNLGRLAYTFPGKTLLVDTLGYVISTEDLSHKGSLGGPVMDVVFDGAVPLLLRAGMVVAAHPTTYVETGRAAIHAETKKLTVSGADVLGFYASVEPATGIEVVTVPLAALAPATPGPGVSPVGLSFTPDDVFADKLGRVLVLAKAQKCIYLWDPVKYEWLAERWMLRGTPEHMTYSAETHVVHLAYASGEVGRLDLNEVAPVERPLFNLPKGVTSLTSAGAFLHLEQFWKSYTYSAAGLKVGQRANQDACPKYAWAPLGRKLYGVEAGTGDAVVCLEVAADGQITALSNSRPQTSFTNPVRVSPDEAYVLTGGGAILTTGTGLPLSGNLGNSVVDAAWLPGGIVAVRTQGSLTLVQRFSGVTFALQGTATLEGTPLRVLGVEGVGYVVMTMVGGRPTFRTYDAAHALVLPAGLPMPANFTATTDRGGGVVLGWEDVQAESGYQIQRSPDNGATWTLVTSPAAGAQAYFDISPAIGQTYLYRMRAVYPGGQYSSYTTPVPGARADPQKVANLLGVLANDLTTVELTWTPSADATSYRVMKRPSTGGNFAQLAELEPQVAAYQDATGTPGNAYEYMVQALKGSVSDSTSPRVTVGVPLPDAPAAFSGVEVDSGVNLSWAAVAAVEGYRVQRRVLPSVSFSPQTVPDPLATEFRDTKVIAGQAYEYRVLAVRKGVASATGPLVQVAVAPPVAPATLTASLDGTGVLLNWPAGSNLSSYRLERRMLPDGEFFTLNLPAPTVLSYLDTGVIPGASYAYQVRSLKGVGISVNAATVEVHLTGPQAPESVTAVYADPVVNVAWTPVPNVAGYRVQRRVQGMTTFATVGTVTHPQTTFTDTGASPGYTYEYRVLSAVGVAISNTAPAVQVTLPPPGTPGPLTATVEAGRVVLTWGAATNITGYLLRRRTLPGVTYVVLANLDAGTTRYEDTDLGQDVMYEYEILGEKNGGHSLGPVRAVVALPVLPAPAEVTAATRPGAVTVRWSAVSGATGYRVYRTPLGTVGWVVVGQVGSAISELVDAQATAGLSYEYGVQSVRGSVLSPVTMVRADVPLPGGPAGLVATLEAGHVRLGWTALPGATGYRVERRLLPDGAFAPLQEEPAGAATTLLDAGVQGGRAYEYRLFSLVGAAVSPEPTGSVSISVPDHLVAIYRMASTTTGSRVGSFMEGGKLKPLSAAVREAAKSYLVVDLTTEEAAEVLYWSEVSAQTKKTVKYYRVAAFDLPFTVLPAGVNKWHFSALESTQGTSTEPGAGAGPWARLRQFTAMAAPYTLLPAKIPYPGLATVVNGRERYTFMGAVRPPVGPETQEFKTYDVTWTGALDVPLTNSTMTAAPLPGPEGPAAEKRSLPHAVRTVINSLVKLGHTPAPVPAP